MRGGREELIFSPATSQLEYMFPCLTTGAEAEARQAVSQRLELKVG